MLGSGRELRSPGGVLVVPSGSGGVGWWGGSEWGGKTGPRGSWRGLNEDAEVDVILLKVLNL